MITIKITINTHREGFTEVRVIQKRRDANESERFIARCLRATLKFATATIAKKFAGGGMFVEGGSKAALDNLVRQYGDSRKKKQNEH